MGDEFDVIVVGGGPADEDVAVHARDLDTFTPASEFGHRPLLESERGTA